MSIRRTLLATFLLALVLAPLAPQAEAARVRVRVSVRTGFPIRRPLPHVVVRTPRVAVRVTPVTYAPVVVFRPVVVAAPPAKDVLVWEDAENLEREDDWTDVTLSCDARGSALYLEVNGRVQVSFAEVVFENGEARVVDFDEKPLKRGIYELLDFRDGRKVDHVRLVARARSDEARLALRMEK